MTIKAFREFWKQYSTTDICKKPLSDLPIMHENQRLELVQWFGPLRGMFSMELVRGKCSWRRGIHASSSRFLFDLTMQRLNDDGYFLWKYRWVL